jgi:hypothetical protein
VGWKAAATNRRGDPMTIASPARVLAEQHDEWTEMRRYIGLNVLARSRAATIAAARTSRLALRRVRQTMCVMVA